jgi:hypothetical protein
MKRIPYLKIKIVSLAAEAVLIRKEEKHWPGESWQREGLHNHRVKEVRKESRVALLAYGFLRGKKFKELERDSYTSPDWTRVIDLVTKYGDEKDRNKISDQLKNWRKEDTLISTNYEERLTA